MYNKTQFKKDLAKLKRLINDYNSMNGGQKGGSGYDVMPKDIAPGVHIQTYKGYENGCAAPLSNMKSSSLFKVGGGSGVEVLTGAVKSMCGILAPMGKKALASLAVLLALNEVGKKQKGGSALMSGLTSKLMPMSKNNLLVLVSLLLINYYMHLHHKGSKSQRGGGVSQLVSVLAPIGTNAFVSAFLLVLSNSFLNKSKRRKRSQSGGSAILSKLEGLLMPLGATKFTVAALLVALNKVFKAKRGQKGGSMSSLTALLMPQGLNVFLTTSGLVALSKAKKSDVKKVEKEMKKVKKQVTKEVKKVLKGGDCGCMEGGRANRRRTKTRTRSCPTTPNSKVTLIKNGKKENIKMRKGGLHCSLNYDGVFTLRQIKALKKQADEGKRMITFEGKRFDLTPRLKRQITLAHTLMTLKNKNNSSKKGMPSKTRRGNKNYTTKRGNKNFHENNKNVEKKRRPYRRKNRKTNRRA